MAQFLPRMNSQVSLCLYINELGLSQRDLAKLCHLPQSSIARLEAGITSPRLDTLEKILAPLGLTIELKKEP